MKHVLKRNNIYYFRIRVPDELKPLFNNKVFYIKSMKTTSKSSAISFAKVLLKKFNFIKDCIYMSIPKKEIEKLVNEFTNTYLVEKEEELYNSDIESNMWVWQLDDIIKEHQIAFVNKNYNFVEDSLKEFVKQNEHLSLSSKDFKKFSELILKNFINDLKLIREKVVSNSYSKSKKPIILTRKRFSPDTIETSKVSNAETKATTDLKEKTYLLKDCCDRYLKQWKIDRKEKGYTKETLGEYEYQVLLLKMYFGEDRNTYSITLDELEDLRELYFDLPAKFIQMNIFKNKSLAYVIANSEDLGKVLGTTIDKYIVKVNSIFSYFATKGYLEKLLSMKKLNAKHRKRKPYSIDEIKTIYDYALKEKSEYRYLILMMMFMGTRLKELTLLTKKDIAKEDGIWCIDINREGEKTTKNENSIRKVPIHEKILELGFLEYVKNLKKDNLFKITNVEFSEYFRKNINPSVTKDDMKSLYSLRHNFITCLINQNIQLSHIAQTVGHEKQYKIIMGTYSHNKINLLKEEVIDKLNYDFEDTIPNIPESIDLTDFS